MKKFPITIQSIVLIFALLFAAFLAVPARAGGVVGDGSPGSCSEAALDLALSDGGQVTFNCGAGPVSISITSQKVIAADTSLDGGGKITLDGGNAIRLFSVQSGITLVLDNLKLAHGSNLQGGAIYNQGQVTIAGSTIFSNAAPGGTGGAIYNQAGVVRISDSTLSNNSASAGLAGCIQNNGSLTIQGSRFVNNDAGMAGGAVINSGVMAVDNSTFSFNNSPGGGGAIDSFGDLTISQTTFFSNTASGGYGGAIYNGGALTVTAVIFSSNTAHNGGGAIFNGGDGLIEHSILSGNSVQAGNDGGGIYNEASSSLTILGSTIEDNAAPGALGGGIYNKGELALDEDTFTGNSVSAGLGGGVNNDTSGRVTVLNSTFSGNTAGLAGGIATGGPITVTNSTFIDNTAGGIVHGGSDAVIVKNTILANNTTYNCSGTITSLGHNLEGANTCGFSAAGDLKNTDPLAGPLTDNGGPTLTHALLFGSPAINAGDNNGCPAVDQRGVPRFGTCDIGAYEFVAKVYLPLVRK